MPNKNLTELLELINLYPSPHNGQPIRLKQIDDSTFELYFQKERGLQAVDVSYIFSFVTMGVFVEHMTLCAQALGHGMSYELTLPKVDDLRGTGVVLFARCTIAWQSTHPDDKLKQSLQFRQTSRKKYYQGVATEDTEQLITIANNQHMVLAQLSKKQTQQAIWLNQRAVFDDMFDEPVRQELNHWLRYTQAQKQSKKDGLSYDCMEINGTLMKYIVDHPKLLKTPGISWIIRQYYLRTMTDASDVFYMLAPFYNEKQSFDVGITIMKLWRNISDQNYYLHPFGTIMSNPAAHHDFADLSQIQNESRESNYLVFIFRCGKSETPTPSLRIPYNEHLILE